MSKPPKIDLDAWTQIKPSTIVYGIGLVISAAVWAVSQSLTTSQHTEAIKDVQIDVKAISKAVADFRQEQAIQSVEIRYLVNGRRGNPPIAASGSQPASIP